MTDRAARGGLSGRWSPRDDRRPNLTGAITLEVDLKAGQQLWLSGWTRSVAGDVEFVSLVAEVADGGPRKARRRRFAEPPSEPEGKFRDLRRELTAGAPHSPSCRDVSKEDRSIALAKGGEAEAPS